MQGNCIALLHKDSSTCPQAAPGTVGHSIVHYIELNHNVVIWLKTVYLYNAILFVSRRI